MKIIAAEQEFRDANWKSVGLRLLVFVRYWAKTHYHWADGALMPGGKTPEDVACDVYVAFRKGERKFADEIPMWVQLKSAAKSILWNLHALKEGKVTRAEEPAYFEPLADNRADQAETLESEEFCTALIAGLYADQKVKKSAELTALVRAIEPTIHPRVNTRIHNKAKLRRPQGSPKDWFLFPHSPEILLENPIPLVQA